MIRRFESTVADHAERGREFGAVHASEVRASVAAYERLFSHQVPVDLADLGAQALRSIDGFAPELGREIRGIAEGAGLPAEHVAAINARTEILAQVGLPTSECSTVVVLGGDGDEPVSAQTWDWYADYAGNWLEWTIPFPDGRRLTTVTEYGIVGKIGVNQSGVGVHLNMLHHDRDGTGIGVPVHVVARKILADSSTVEHGLATCAAAAVSASTCLTLVGSRAAGKAAVSVELWPGGPGQAHPQDGLLVHTNHFLSEPARAGDTTAPDPTSTTLTRFDALRRRLAVHDGGWPAVLDAMTEHDGAVCCHPEYDGPPPYYATLATVRLDLGTATVHTSAGGPCVAS